MIVGLGVDFIELERVRRTIERHGERFFERILTPAERAYCERYRDPVPHAAARFAAKEAALKALGTGLANGIRWQEVEVERGEEGPPTLRFSGVAERVARAKGAGLSHLTISHDRGAAIAVVVLESAT